MTRYVIAACLLLAVLFGAGFGLRRVLWSDERPPSAAAHGTLPVPPTPAPVVIELIAVDGKVETRDHASATWHEVGEHAKLDADDTVRTGEGATATLSIGPSLQVDLAERSEFTLADITRELSNLRLESGRVAARLAPDASARLRLEVRGSEAVAESNEGSFSALRAEDGQVTFAATKGKVSVATKRRSVELVAGLQSTVPAQGEPATPIKIPPSLFLKLAQSARRQLNRRETALSGVTAPGAIVSVNGVPARTDASGQFTSSVPLQEGQNKLRVTATDVLGRTEERTIAVDVDTKAPKLGSKVVW